VGLLAKLEIRIVLLDQALDSYLIVNTESHRWDLMAHVLWYGFPHQVGTSGGALDWPSTLLARRITANPTHFLWKAVSKFVALVRLLQGILQLGLSQFIRKSCRYWGELTDKFHAPKSPRLHF
jgi:hypothetical protein